MNELTLEQIEQQVRLERNKFLSNKLTSMLGEAKTYGSSGYERFNETLVIEYSNNNFIIRYDDSETDTSNYLDVVCPTLESAHFYCYELLKC